MEPARTAIVRIPAIVKRTFGLLGLLSLPLVVACSSNTTAGSGGGDEGALSDYSSSESYRTLLKCDGAELQQGTSVHRVTVVNGGSASEQRSRAIRFVVTDPSVVSDLSSRVNHIQNANRQVALQGYIGDGDDFDWFEDWSFAPMSSRPDGNQTRIRTQIGGVVHRVHGEDGKVRIVFNNTTFTDHCDTYFDEDHCAARGGNAVPIRTDRNDDAIVDHVFSCSAP